MTDDEIPSEFESKLNFICSLHGIDSENTEMNHREIGNGPQFNIQLYEENSSNLVWESPWFDQEQMENYLRGMDNIQTLKRKSDN